MICRTVPVHRMRQRKRSVLLALIGPNVHG
jgi:hypothetical protein